MKLETRRIHDVPFFIRALLIMGLGLQLSWYHLQPPPALTIQALPPPPEVSVLRLFSFGETTVTAKILMLWLQSFDNQTGQFLPYERIDYDALVLWLTRIMELDPQSDYPLMAATHIYTNVSDKNKKIKMLDFVYTAFLQNPAKRWQWLAHATVLAKHRLRDLPLALKYADAIAAHADINMPRWAQEMQVFILEDMGEFERAQLIIGGILSSGQVKDAGELQFLTDKLRNLQNQQTIQR